MMNFITKSLAIEIENFVSFLNNDCGISTLKSFTKGAFVQNRNKIKPEVFKKLSSIIIDEFYEDNDASVKLWQGFRILAVDGSSIALPLTKELMKKYGETKNQTKTSVVHGRVSVLYDALNNFVLDGILAPKSVGERALAIKHLAYCKLKDLVVYDRGYPCFDLIYEHHKRHVEFLMRVKASFSTATKEFVESGKSSLVIDMFPGKNTKIKDKEYDRNFSIKVRMIRVELPGGEIEILLTSLLDKKKYKDGIFKDLYYKRWKVETFYDELKNKLKVEHFSGYSDNSILQDFYAALFVSNIQSLIVNDIEEELQQENKNTKFQYKINTNVSYGLLKNRIISLFFSDKDMETIMDELRYLFKRHLVPIRPDRSFQRNANKYRNRIRPKVTKNQKDAI